MDNNFQLDILLLQCFLQDNNILVHTQDSKMCCQLDTHILLDISLDSNSMLDSKILLDMLHKKENLLFPSYSSMFQLDMEWLRNYLLDNMNQQDTRLEILCVLYKSNLQDTLSFVKTEHCNSNLASILMELSWLEDNRNQEDMEQDLLYLEDNMILRYKVDNLPFLHCYCMYQQCKELL